MRQRIDIKVYTSMSCSSACYQQLRRSVQYNILGNPTPITAKLYLSVPAFSNIIIHVGGVYMWNEGSFTGSDARTVYCHNVMYSGDDKLGADSMHDVTDVLYYDDDSNNRVSNQEFIFAKSTNCGYRYISRVQLAPRSPSTIWRMSTVSLEEGSLGLYIIQNSSFAVLDWCNGRHIYPLIHVTSENINKFDLGVRKGILSIMNLRWTIPSFPEWMGILKSS